MATSRDIRKLSYEERAEMLLHMLNSPVSKSKDVVKFALGGAVETDEIRHVSVAAKKILDKNGFKSSNGRYKNKHYKKDKKDIGLIVEHVVPTEFLYRWILSKKNDLSLNMLTAVLKNCCICLITKEEHKMLDAAGLESTMPDARFNCMSDDCFSRYKAAGIKMS